MNKLDTLSDTDLQKMLNKLHVSASDEGTHEELIHDLQVHQIELEMQNRELIASQTAIEKARDKYADLYDFAPIGYISFSNTGCIQNINLTACILLGAERANLVNKPFINYLTSDSINTFYKHIKETLSKSQKIRDELTIKTRQNNIIYAYIESTSYVDEHQKPVTQSAIIDITQQKLNEERLHQERDFADRVLKTAQSIVVVLDTNGKIQRVNPYFEKLSGYTLQEIQGKNWFDLFIFKSDRTHVRSIFNEATSGKKTIGNINDIVTRDNQRRTIQWFDSNLKDSSGNITGLLAIGEDITEHIATETKAREIDHQLKLITDAMPVAITFIDLDENIIFCNNTFHKWFPLNDHQYNGKSIKDVFGIDIYNTLSQFIESALNYNQVSCELKLSHNESQPVFFANLIPNISSNNTINGLFIVINDITRYKTQETSLLKHLNLIAHESRINLIGQMTAEVAHEINQPLTAISTYATVGKNTAIKNTPNINNIVDIFNNIQKQVARINDIILLLRSFTQKRDVTMNDTDLNLLITDLINLFSSQHFWQDITLTKDLSKTQLIVKGNKILLEQVIINLINNAVDALKESRPTNPLITIHTYIDSGKAYINVTDNCGGISPDMSGQIFEPFYSTKESGLGLGLSICKTIVDAHHGNIWVMLHNQSETTFTIELPLANSTT